MKGLMLLVVMLLLAGFIQAAPEWDNVNVIQVNTERPHATLMVYPSAKAAMKEDPGKSPWFKSLNGDWKFQWSENPEKRPTEFYKQFFDDSHWDEIPVPSNWQLQGYGVPVYKNMGLAFPKDVPNAPKEFNPVGSYRTEFKISKGWKNRRIYLHFDGVDAACYVWVNGKKAGYSQGSRTPAEFDITKFVKPGKNLLAVEVYRFCDGSYLEDQDFWRLSGIFRDVYLFSTAQQHIRDFSVVTDLDEYYRNAELKVKAEVLNPDGFIEMELFDADGRSVVQKRVKARRMVAFNVPVAAPRKWTAETPNLYKLLLTLEDATGKVVEVIPQNVGFRETEIRGEAFLLNGKPILLKGVNRHEHNPDTGHVVTRETMMRDIALFKKYNINAVRTSHYANHPLWLDLCSRYGIYVMGEANLETHFAGNDPRNQIANSPEWTEQMVDRMRRMVARDRNQASVVIWSMGNEAGDGPNFKACIDWIHQADPTRSVHYEGSGKHPGAPHSDWGSNMYAAPGVDGEPGKPYLLCEYTHAMGNSNGNLTEYWDAIYASKRHHGAFVWDWMDQGLRVPVPEGKTDPFGRRDAFAYGRFWADYHGNAYDEKYGNDIGQFCMNGLLAADGTPHPGLAAIKHAYRNIHVQPVDLSAGRIRVRNWFDFINTGDIAEGRWAVVSEGRKIAEGKFQPLEIAPRAEREITLPLPEIVPEPGKEYFLNLEFVTKADAFYAKAGHVLAREQFKLPVYEAAAALPSIGLPELALDQTETTIAVKGEDFTVTFDTAKGTLSSYVFQGLELIQDGPRPDFWRARTDNDMGAVRHKYVSDGWKTAGRDAKVTAVQIRRGAGTVMVMFKLELPKELGSVITYYAVYGSGEVAVETKYKKGSKKDLKQLVYRYGTALAMPAGFENITWYGRGELPTYSDRKFEPIGIYSGTVDGQWIDYSNPQENGNKVDVRWVALQDKKGRGLLFKGVQPLSVGARHFSMEDIEKAPYTFEMTRRDEVLVNIDLAQNGVGGNNSWGAVAMPDYLLPAVDFSYRFHILPIKAKAKDLPELGRSLVGAERTCEISLPKLQGRLQSAKWKKKKPEKKKTPKKKKKTATQ